MVFVTAVDVITDDPEGWVSLIVDFVVEAVVDSVDSANVVFTAPTAVVVCDVLI